jgi:hypothetical protein
MASQRVRDTVILDDGMRAYAGRKALTTPIYNRRFVQS